MSIFAAVITMLFAMKACARLLRAFSASLGNAAGAVVLPLLTGVVIWLAGELFRARRWK